MRITEDRVNNNESIFDPYHLPSFFDDSFDVVSQIPFETITQNYIRQPQLDAGAIEIKKSLSLECASCFGTFVKKCNTSGRPRELVSTIQDCHYQTKRLHVLLSTLQQISKASNQDLFDIVQLWFQKKEGKDKFLEFLEGIVLKHKEVENQIRSLLSSKKRLTSDDIIFVR